MAKKRKASQAKGAAGSGPGEVDPKDARLAPITSYKDIADDQERYFLDREEDQDQILFDEAPLSKKQKRQQQEEDFLEPSDDEVLGYNDDDSSDEDDDEDEKPTSRKQKADASSRKNKKGGKAADEDEDEEEGDAGWWGSSRKEYYNNDAIETEADALEEEQEARRLQKKKLAKMSEEDFFNEDEWLGGGAGAEGEDGEDKDDEGDAAVVTEVLKDVEIPADMPADERYRLLQNMYPELDYMADTLLELQPLLVTLQKEAEGQDSKSLAVVKYRILGCYVASLAMYFATLTAPSRDAEGEAKPLSPAELRDHEVMATLLECREAWKKVEPLQSTVHKTQPDAEDVVSDLDEDEEAAAAAAAAAAPKKASATSTTTKRQAKADRKAKALEASLAELDNLVASATKKTTTKKSSSKRPTAQPNGDESDDSENNNNSDFGEEDVLDARAAAEKAARKKSLRFYTSQIVQKANRRAGAGRDAGGDMDIPYRERLKDRQARLNAEAEKRGLKASGRGSALGDDGLSSGGEDEEDKEDAAQQSKVAAEIRDNEDEYYDMVASRTTRKKEDKSARAAALAAASATERVVETETVDADGKRKITYAIEKNKGLAPKRNKDNRNPRVKKRKMYAERQKKLRSMKATYKGGEGKGGYGGELTGIKAGLVKSTKL